jgi:hypothetical protein
VSASAWVLHGHTLPAKRWVLARTVSLCLEAAARLTRASSHLADKHSPRDVSRCAGRPVRQILRKYPTALASGASLHALGSFDAICSTDHARRSRQHDARVHDDLARRDTERSDWRGERAGAISAWIQRPGIGRGGRPGMAIWPA